MKERFIGEPIAPVPGSFGDTGPELGEPALPTRFRWRGEEYEVERLMEKWKQSGPGRGDGKDRYLRKHYYRIRTRCGLEMKLFFERQPPSRGAGRQRWWLSTLIAPELD